MIGNKPVVYISVEDIVPNRFQPRLSFDEKGLNELADSIRQHGVIQPLLLRKMGSKYEIIAGERRYKASCIAGLNNVPCIVVETDDNTSAEIAITENIQRKDLSAMEEAQSYKKLVDKGNTQDEIAKKLGIGQSTVANKIRLLSLSEESQDALLKNKISERHARGLLRITDIPSQIKLLNRIINEKLTVKQTDDEINKMLNSQESENGGGGVGFLDIEIPNFETSTQKFEEEKEEIFEIEEEPVKIISEEKEEPEENEDLISSVLDTENKVMSPFEEDDLKDDEIFGDFKYKPEPMRFEDSMSDNDFFEEKNDKQESELKNSVSKYLGVVKETRKFISSLESAGDNVSAEEFDFEDMYQIVIKIKKEE